MEVPRELAERRQWVCWKEKKIPFQPNGAPAKSNDPATWSSLDECQAATGYSGIGYVFSPDDPFCGIDLDGCYRDGEIEHWAAEILDQFPSYAEVSPSGLGIKLWIRGKLPDGRGRKKEIGTGQAVELYDRGRYFCFTGQSLGDLEIADCQQALDALLARLWPQAAPVAHVRPVDDVPARAAAYLQRVPPAVSGQNGHGHTIRVAAILVRGFELDQETAFNVMQTWNDTCQPPWSERELRHKLSDAAKREGERGWLLNGREYTGPDADLRALLARLAGGDVVAVDDDDDEDFLDESKDPGPFPKDCLRPPGLLSDIIDYNLQTAIYPQPVLALAGALAIVAVVTGRKIRLRRDTRTNLMLLVLAPTGIGKDHARNVAKKVLIAAGCDKMIGQDRITSHAGIISQLASSQASLLQPDEFQSTIESACHGRNSPHLKHIPEILKEAYSAAVTPLWKPSGYGDRKFNVEIDQPHLVLHATGVGTEFWEACSKDLVTGGVIGRMILFDVPGIYSKPVDVSVDDPPQSLVAKVAWWREFAGDGNLFSEHPRPVIVEESPEAKRRILDHMETIRERQTAENGLRSALWARAGQKTGQLALTLAASRMTEKKTITVERQDVDLAIKINNWSTRKLAWHCENHMADSQYAKMVNKVLDCITARGISRREWTRKTYRIAERNIREKILQDAVDSGHIEVVEVATKTNKKTVVRLSQKRESVTVTH